MGSGHLMRLTLTVAALAATACSGSDDGDDAAATAQPDVSTTTTTEGPRPCEEDRHLVAFDVIGTLTTNIEEGVELLNDPDANPPARDLAAPLVTAYHERGYEILYVIHLPESFTVEGVPLIGILQGWLSRNGFPVEGAAFETSDTDDSYTELSADFVDLAGQGISVDAAYTDGAGDVQAYAVGGVGEVYLMGEEGGGDGASTTIPEGALTSHLAAVEALPRVCT